VSEHTGAAAEYLLSKGGGKVQKQRDPDIVLENVTQVETPLLRGMAVSILIHISLQPIRPARLPSLRYTHVDLIQKKCVQNFGYVKNFCVTIGLLFKFSEHTFLSFKNSSKLHSLWVSWHC
jgi:hypothetical protein